VKGKRYGSLILARSRVLVTERVARSWSRCTGSQPAPVGDVSSHCSAIGCHHFPPGLRSPSQQKNVTVLRPVPCYCLVTEARSCEQLSQGCYTQLCPDGNCTHDLLITSPTPYRYVTVPSLHNVSKWKQRTNKYQFQVLNTNPETIPNINTNPNPSPKLTQILTTFSCFVFFEHRPFIFSLAFTSNAIVNFLEGNNHINIQNFSK